MTTLSPSMLVLNQGRPFVSEQFAERLAKLVVDEKYPTDIFSVRGPGTVSSKGDSWLATFENALVPPEDGSPLPMSNGKIIPRRLTITIRKTNGEIVAIS